MTAIGDWLASLELQQYAPTFEEEQITLKVLPSLTDQDLKDLGVSLLGHRRALLMAIDQLGSPQTVVVGTAPAEIGAHPVQAKDAALGKAPGGERRQITVLFCDLVGSTALSAQLDPEDLRVVVSAYHRGCADLVEANGGYVAQYLGDGILAYFGYPRAHEHDAERAVRAGLALAIAAPNLVTAPGIPLAVRVGIATGVVVVGDLMRAGEGHERGVVGETPNFAARLQGLAQPGSVVIAESTRRLVGDLFELADLGPHELKGIGARARAWSVLRSRAVESRFEALHGAAPLTALVGREEELELLDRRWAKAKDGVGQVVLVAGEPGIGKSRLTVALMEHLAAEPHTRMRFFCSPQNTDSAFFPIIGQLERAAGLAPDDAPAAKLDKLDALLAHGAASREDAALIADLLSLPPDGRHPAQDLDAQHRRQRTLQALSTQVEALARAAPVLMILEDAHWSDPTSLEAFGRTVDRIADLRALLVVTYRPEFEPAWIGRPHVTTLTLNRLGRPDIVALIARVAGNKALPEATRADILERTDGIPLFVEEMTKAVLEAESEGEARRTMAAASSPAATVPASLHASLMARLDRLGPAKEVAQVGAAIGREFSHALIDKVDGRPRKELAAALDRLVAAGLLFRQGEGEQASYLFKHALVQDAAYGTLLREPRRALHARIVEALEKGSPEVADRQPELLARHCANADLNEKAVVYRLTAGQRAVSRSAMIEAVTQLEIGLKLLASLPASPESRQRELDLRVALGPALIATRGYSSSDVGDTLARASAAAEELGRFEYLVPLLYGQWAYHLVRAEYRLSLPFAERLEEIGETQDNRPSMLLGRFYRGVVCYFFGNFVAARNLFEQCHDLGDPQIQKILSGFVAEDPYCLMLGYLSCTLTYIGHFDQAIMRASQALLEARRLQRAYTLAFVVLFQCWVTFVVNQPEDVKRHSDELIKLSKEHGYPLMLGYGMCWRGWSLASLRDPLNALGMATEGLSLVRATGANISTALSVMMIATVHGILGQPDDGLRKLDEAALFIEATDERYHEAEVCRVRGDLLHAVGDPEAAERSYRRGLAVSEIQEAKCLQLRIATSLGRLLREQGRLIEGQKQLASIYGWFNEGLGTQVVRDAKALLDELA